MKKIELLLYKSGMVICLIGFISNISLWLVNRFKYPDISSLRFMLIYPYPIYGVLISFIGFAILYTLNKNANGE